MERRNTIALLTLIGLLGWATGFELHLHHHEAGEEHDHQRCVLCATIAAPASANTPNTEAVSITPAFEYDQAVPDAQAMNDAADATPITPRAPPTP